MFRVVDVHTGAVVGADKVRYVANTSHVTDQTQVMSSLMDAFTTEGVGTVVLRLFPIKVLGTAGDGVIYLNRGADAGLDEGTMFDVMRPGEDLKDPDTGISFGSAETKVASVEVVSVEANRAKAKLVSGNVAQAGDILRKPQAVEKPPEPKVRKPDW
jgi:hypothetical protein